MDFLTDFVTTWQLIAILWALFAGEEELKRVRLSHHSFALPRWNEIFGWLVLVVGCGGSCFVWLVVCCWLAVLVLFLFGCFSEISHPRLLHTKVVALFLSQWKGTGLAS